MEPIRFQVNGRPVSATGVAPTTTLLEYLRGELGLVGTKEGCAEGDCGACTVAVLDPGGPDGPCYRAVNSCLLLLPMLQGLELWTVEGIGSPEAPHPVQEALIRAGASQCGYCTPGFVMSLFEGSYRDDPVSEVDREEQLSGNLCRCTGYRPLREVAHELVGSRPRDRHLERLERAWGRAAEIDCGCEGQRFVAPGTLEALFEILEEEPQARIVAGATDLAIEVTKQHSRLPLVVSLQALPELRTLGWQGETLQIGATVPLSDLERETRRSLPVLARMLRYFGSRQIKHRATLGGNLCTASPVGDLAPVLLALEARLVLCSRRGERELPIDRFFTSYRETALRRGEILASVRVERPAAGVRRGSYKVSRRRELDIATVSAAFAVKVSDEGTVERARLAYGGMAAVPARALAAERALLGQPWRESTVERAAGELESDFTPIDDHRGSAWYRRTVARNLLLGFYEETLSEPFVPLPDRPVATLLAQEGR